MTYLKKHLTPSFLIACLALAVSLSGVAYAAATIGAKDIKQNAVTTKHIRKNAVTTKKIRNGTVRPADLSAAARTISGYEIALEPGIMAVGQHSGGFTAQCPEGKVAIGGGVATFNEDIHVMTSTPLENLPRVWFVATETYSGNPIAVDSSVNVRVVCVHG